MESGLLLLSLNAVAVAFIHTLIGPDHYVPFIAMARARRWAAWRTALITLACGLGHVGSALVLGLVAAAGGLEIQKIAHIESFRGHLAIWGLIAFGAVYFVWGLRRAIRGHGHRHGAGPELAPQHGDAPAASLMTWILFTIFVFGPCEPMIPLIMFPAAGHNWLGVALVSVVFGSVTIASMLTLVLSGLGVVQLVPRNRMERFGHALAGATILLTGGAMQIFSL